MKKALRQTVEELKEEQEEKRKEMEKERRVSGRIRLFFSFLACLLQIAFIVHGFKPLNGLRI